MAALGRWNLDVDDSGGDSLMNTPAGIFARLVAQTVAEEFAPAVLLALLKHPLLHLGLQGVRTAVIGDLELAILRGPRPAPGSAGLANDFALFRVELAKLHSKESTLVHHSEPRAAIGDARLDAVHGLIERLIAAFKPLESINRSKPADHGEKSGCQHGNESDA